MKYADKNTEIGTKLSLPIEGEMEFPHEDGNIICENGVVVKAVFNKASGELLPLVKDMYLIRDL